MALLRHRVLLCFLSFFILIAGCSFFDMRSIAGSWLITSVTCNGVPGVTTSGGAGEFVPPNGPNILVLNSNGTGHTSIQVGSCTIVFPITYTNTESAITLTYHISTCSPAGCLGVACNATAPTTSFRYALTDGNTINATGIIDTKCTNATPAQENPVDYVLKRI